MERESLKHVIRNKQEKQSESAAPTPPEAGGFSFGHLHPEREELKAKRTPQEVIELEDRLRFVARLLLNNFDLKILSDNDWAVGFSERFQEERRKYPDKSLEEFDPSLLVPEIIKYPEKDLLERSEDYIWGMLRHEISRFRHYDYQSLIKALNDVKQEGYNPLDFFMIFNAWEDGRSNNMEGQTSKTAHYRIGIYLKEALSEALLADFEKKPLPIQYGALCWAKGAESFIEGFNFEELKARIKDEKVLKAFEKTQEALDEYLGENKGRRAFTDVLWQKGWPVFKELIDIYLEDEAKKNHAQKQKERSEKSKEPQRQQSGKSSGESEKSGESQQLHEGTGQHSGQEEKQRMPGQQTDRDKSWSELSQEEKERYINEARNKLTKEESGFGKCLQPKSIQFAIRNDGTIEAVIQSVAPEDIKRAEREERNLKEEKKYIKQEVEKRKKVASGEIMESLEKLKERETELTKKEREQYEKYFAGVKKYVHLLTEKLDEVFPPQEEAGWEGGMLRGKRIDTKKLASEVPTGHGRVFEKKEVPEIKEAAFILLIDVSGSMRGENIEEAIKAAVLMAEAFSRKGIPFEILAFNSRLFELKQFDEDYSGKKKIQLVNGLLTALEGPNTSSDTGFANDSAARRLQKRLFINNAQGALIILTDGVPAPSQEHSGPEWELHGIVNKWSKQIPMIGVGIGTETITETEKTVEIEAMIEEYYGKNGLAVPDVTKLPRELLNILQKQLKRFEKINQ